jgi:hypothetical protein
LKLLNNKLNSKKDVKIRRDQARHGSGFSSQHSTPDFGAFWNESACCLECRYAKMALLKYLRTPKMALLNCVCQKWICSLGFYVPSRIIQSLPDNHQMYFLLMPAIN